MSMSTTGLRWAAALILLGACGRQGDPAVGAAAAERARAHVASGRAATERLTQGLSRTIDGASAPVGAAMADPVRLRRALRDLHDDRTDIGRALSLYPTSFIAAVRPDGKAAASDREATPDPVADKDLGAAFPCVRAALQGTAGACAGQFSLTQGLERRWFVAVTPARATADGPVVGAVLAAMTFGNVAKAVRGALNIETARDNVQLVVGILHDGRTYPSGSDNDVPSAFLVRDPLLRVIPQGTSDRAAREVVTFTFAQNDGRMQWGAAAGPVPTLGDGASLLVYRAPLRQ